MSTGEVIGAIIIALIIGGIFYYGFKSRGPWGSFWTFFLVIAFAVLVAAAWVRPVGAVWWGIAWFPLIFVGLLFALLLAAASPTEPRAGYRRTRYIDDTADPVDTDPELARTEPVDATADDEGVVAVGVFFWMMLTLFFVFLIAGIFF